MILFKHLRDVMFGKSEKKQKKEEKKENTVTEKTDISPKNEQTVAKKAETSQTDVKKTDEKAEKTAEKAEESTTKEKKSAPEVKEPVAEAKEPAPEAKEPVAEAEEPAPEVKEPVAEAEESAPEVKEPVVEKNASKKKAGAQKSAPASLPKTVKDKDPSAAKLTFISSEKDTKAAFEKACAEADEQIAKNPGKAVGKYEFRLEEDGYHFDLTANNGQVLFDSPGFTTLIGTLSGIKTFQKTVGTTEFDIKKDKYDRYRFILANKYYGENYSTKEQCLKSAESVKNFANNSKIIPYKPSADLLEAYEAAKKKRRTADDVDWAAVAQREAEAQKFGKFELSKENDEYCFYLLANNGQILYSSRYYSSETTCRKGIDAFKKAVYVGNFFVDPDKFGTYRYVLKNLGSAPCFIGESYESRARCERAIESVKNFVVTASIDETIN